MMIVQLKRIQANIRGFFSLRSLLLILTGCLLCVYLFGAQSAHTVQLTGPWTTADNGSQCHNQTDNRQKQGKEKPLEEKELDIKTIMSRRISRMKSVCSKYKLDVIGKDPLHTPYPWEYILNKEHKLVWCNVFKSSSTSWMYIFNLLAGYDPKFLDRTKEVPLQLARNKYGRPKLDELQRTINSVRGVSFLVGRNPFERLVSGYRDKIQNAFPGSHHDKLRRIITKTIRGVNVPRAGKLSPGLIPTFTEFVKFILEEERKKKEFDMHWATVYKFCTPCLFNLSDIILYETQARDAEHILKKAGVFDKVGAISHKNPTKGKGSSKELTVSFISELPDQLFLQLVDLYRIDFELFGYEVPFYSDYHQQVFDNANR